VPQSHQLLAFTAPLALFLASASVSVTFGQSVPAAATPEEPDVQSIMMSSADTDVSTDAASARIHMMPVLGTIMKQDWPADAGTGTAPVASAAAVPAPGAASGIAFYPGDISNPFNNVTIDTAENHNVYLNALPSVWGHPARFLRHLSKSDFIHVTDQYVNTTADDRYRVGKAAYVLYPTAPHTLTPTDIYGILHAAGGTFGTGYHDVYHVFVPPGTDVCTSPTSCYSPDNPSTFRFCAYHGAVTFSDIGHVIYSVEPYQNVPGCALSGALPNGVVTDSTASVLSHELFELITDPDLNAWWNRVDLDLRGAEIGDICQRAIFSYDTPLLHGRPYEIQPEYSNAAHACVFSPTPPE
jgi:hypothetical protein